MDLVPNGSDPAVLAPNGSVAIPPTVVAEPIGPAREQSEVVGSKRQVHTRLMETGRIKTDPQVPGKRRRFTKRATVEEHRREVLWVPHDVLFLDKPSG